MSSKHSMVKPNSKEKVTKPKDLYSHSTYGHTHNYAAQKTQVKKIYSKTYKKGPKKIWVPKKIIIYVTIILSSRVEIPTMVF